MSRVSSFGLAVATGLLALAPAGLAAQGTDTNPDNTPYGTTSAEFRQFAVGLNLAAGQPDPATLAKVAAEIDKLPPLAEIGDIAVASLGGERLPNAEAVLLAKAKELEARGINYVYRNEITESGRGKYVGEPQCLLVNTTGELKFFYEQATVIFVGKSLSAHGGQNPIEPGALRKAGLVLNAMT